MANVVVELRHQNKITLHIAGGMLLVDGAIAVRAIFVKTASGASIVILLFPMGSKVVIFPNVGPAIWPFFQFSKWFWWASYRRSRYQTCSENAWLWGLVGHNDVDITPDGLLLDQCGEFWLQGTKCESFLQQSEYRFVFRHGNDICQDHLKILTQTLSEVDDTV